MLGVPGWFYCPLDGKNTKAEPHITMTINRILLHRHKLHEEDQYDNTSMENVALEQFRSSPLHKETRKRFWRDLKNLNIPPHHINLRGKYLPPPQDFFPNTRKVKRKETVEEWKHIIHALHCFLFTPIPPEQPVYKLFI